MAVPLSVGAKQMHQVNSPLRQDAVHVLCRKTVLGSGLELYRYTITDH